MTGSITSLDQKALALESDELQLLKEQQNIIDDLRKRLILSISGGTTVRLSCRVNQKERETGRLLSLLAANSANDLADKFSSIRTYEGQKIQVRNIRCS